MWNFTLLFRKLLQIYLSEWKKYVPLSKREKLKEQRIAELYKRVKELIPDFDPDDCSDCSSDHSIDTD